MRTKSTPRRQRAMWQMIGVLAELERNLNVERTQAGMTEARRRGVKFGRKKKLTPAQITKATKLIEAGERVADVAALWERGSEDALSGAEAVITHKRCAEGLR